MECILLIELAVHKEVCALLVKLVGLSADPQRFVGVDCKS